MKKREADEILKRRAAAGDRDARFVLYAQSSEGKARREAALAEWMARAFPMKQ